MTKAKKAKTKRSRRNRVILGPDAYIRGAPVSSAKAATNLSRHLANECPIPLTHARLADCHIFWHRAFDEYHRPQPFRRELNVLLQALRNVTFILQSEKSTMPDFADWYKGWQDKMRADPIMRWLIEARNTVVKQGDLEAKSVATAKVVYSYASYEVEITDAEFRDLPTAAEGNRPPSISPPPSTTIAEQRKMLVSGLPARVVEDGFIQFERRWIDSKLATIEVLEACAHVYGILTLMVDDLHERMGYTSSIGVELGEHSTPEAGQYSEGRPPCMAVPEFIVMRRRIKDGSIVVGGLRILEGAEARKNADRAKRRYVQPDPPEEVGNITDLADWQMARARAILTRDKNHGQFVLLYKGVDLVKVETISVYDQADKIVIMSELARVVERSGIDGVIMISDNWTSPLTVDEDGFPVPAREHKERREALNVDAIDAFGHRKHLWSEYSRANDKIVFDGEPIDMTNHSKAPYLAPILEVWRRQP